GDLMQFRRVDRPRKFSQLERVQLTQFLTSAVQFLLDLECRLSQLGMRFGRPAEYQRLVAASQPRLIVAAVQAETHHSGAELARPGVGLLHQDHRSGDLSRGGCRSKCLIEPKRLDETGNAVPLVTRLSYRILRAHQTALATGIPPLPEMRPATVLRSAQAIP